MHDGQQIRGAIVTGIFASLGPAALAVPAQVVVDYSKTRGHEAIRCTRPAMPCLAAAVAQNDRPRAGGPTHVGRDLQPLAAGELMAGRGLRLRLHCINCLSDPEALP